MTDVTVANPTPPAAVEQPGLQHIIERYLRDPSVDVTKLEQMVALQERMMRWQAETAWNVAMAEAQSRMHAVGYDSNNPQTRSRYASYAAMDGTLRPIYSPLGFALSFNTEEAREGVVKVVCDVSRGGHTRRYQIEMPADGKGAKGGEVMTRTHATGSAVSYGMRYLLKMIFNVSTGDLDDDGNSAGRGSTITRRPPPPAPNPMPPYDPQTGEIIESPGTATAASSAHRHPATDGAVDDGASAERLLQLDNRLEEAAEKGMAALQVLWMTLSKTDRFHLKGALDGRHKPRAIAVDMENGAA